MKRAMKMKGVEGVAYNDIRVTKETHKSLNGLCACRFFGKKKKKKITNHKTVKITPLSGEFFKNPNSHGSSCKCKNYRCDFKNKV